MGKLRYALVNLWFWTAMIFMNFLTENHTLMVGNNMGSLDPTSLFILALSAVICLFMFIFISHKDNKVKPDLILLTIMTILGFFFLLAIWASPNSSYAFADGSDSTLAELSTFERFAASLILVIFLTFMYTYLYMVRVNSLRNRQFIWLLYIGIFTGYLSLVLSLILDRHAYMIIAKGLDNNNLPSVSIDSFYGNKNYYGGVLLIAILSCMGANYYKPRLFHFVSISILTVALMATASILPIMIALIAVPIYLLEEITYYAIKKRWARSIYAVIASLILLSLVIVFYIGSQVKWKGFSGTNDYISKVFSQKSFETISGRVAIWNALIPHIADNPFTIIFGHGFMVSEKHIFAITAALNNNVLNGVRTTHNGYIQVLYEFGLLGGLVHLGLICYYIYACIRLLMHKRFHYVFVYTFIMICIGVYNAAESSLLFDSCVKEMFITVAFAMPIIGDFKGSVRPTKIKEIKQMKVMEGHMNSIKLGQGMALVFASIVATSLMMFLSTDTLLNHWHMRYWMANIAIGGVLCTLTIPYLLSLYHRNTDKLVFNLHIVGNACLLILLTFIPTLVLLKHPTGRRFLPFILPFIVFIFLMSEMVIYFWIKKGNMKEWWIVTFKGALLNARYAYGGLLLLGGMLILFTQLNGELNSLSYSIMYFVLYMIFFASFHFFPTKGGREVLDEYNQVGLRRVQYIYLKDEKYYG